MSYDEVKMQRDQALACFALAACISAAVFLSVFGKTDKLAIESAQKQVAVHEELLKQSATVLQQNQSALAAVQAALDSIKRSRKR